MFSQLGGLWANQAFEGGCFNHLSRLLGSLDPRLFGALLEHAKPDRHCMRLFKHPLRLFLNCSLLPQVGTDRLLGSTKEVAGK